MGTLNEEYRKETQHMYNIERNSQEIKIAIERWQTTWPQDRHSDLEDRITAANHERK